MKSFRFVLSLVAILSAIGGAIASSVIALSPVSPVYQFIDGPLANTCQTINTTCTTSGPVTCRINGTGDALRDTDGSNPANASACGVVLRRDE